uniref:Uncharacterized protein n=1 Tax=viral metagenome TaxID=1070528 RepID=A0A6M3M6R3_9ZZZZ
MASRNYLINSEDLSLSDKKNYKMAAIAAGIERCAVKNVGSPNADIPGLQAIPESKHNDRTNLIRSLIATGEWPRSIDMRELAPGPAAVRTDFAVPTVLAEALTAPLAVVDTWYSCFQAVAAPQLLVGKLAVFWGVSIETVPIPVSYLEFLRGTNVQAVFDLQTQNTRLAFNAFFSEPVVFDPQDTFTAQVLCRIVAPASRVHLHNFLFEKAGDVIA